MPHGDLLLFDFLVADDQHVGHLLHFCFPDLKTDLFIAVIQLHPDHLPAQLLIDLPGVVVMTVGDRHNHCLHRRQPKGESPGIVLDQDPEETLQRPHQGPVHHHRTVRFAVFADILQLEALRQVKIDLHRGALPGTAQYILDLEIDLRPVEHPLAGIDFIIQLADLQGLPQRFGGFVPIFNAADILLGPRRQVNLIVFEPERAQDQQHQVHRLDDLVGQLFRGAEDMRIVLGKAAHPHQTVQHPGALEAVDRAQLGIADRQIAVAAQIIFIDRQVEGAVHRFELIFHLLQIHRSEHVLAIKPGMAAGFPQVQLCRVGRVDDLVIVFIMLFQPKIFHHPANPGPFGMPQDQAVADRFLDGKKIEFLAQFTVVPFLGLFQAIDVLLQHLLLRVAGGVDALQHLVALIPAPVSAGQGEQLEIFAQAAGGRHVRPPAEIGKFALSIGGDGLFIGQIVDQLDLEIFMHRLEQLQGFLTFQHPAGDGIVLFDHLHHFRFQFDKLLRSDVMIELNIIIKTAVDRRADPQLGVGIFALDRLGHHVGGTVPEDLPAFLIIEGQDLQGAAFLQRPPHFHDPPVELHRQGLFEQALADPFSNLRTSNTGGIILFAPIGKMNYNVFTH